MFGINGGQVGYRILESRKGENEHSSSMLVEMADRWFGIYIGWLPLLFSLNLPPLRIWERVILTGLAKVL